MTSPLSRLCLVALIISLSSPAIAQRSSTTRRRTTPSQRQAEDARRRFEEEVRRLRDQGTDLAFVYSVQAAIHEEANSTSPTLMKVKRGEALALAEREPEEGWYRVIHIDTATEGWIDARDVVIKLSAEERSGPPLVEEEAGANQNPELSVTNEEQGTDLNLRINGTLYVVRRGTTRTLTLQPGTYRYYGYSPGIAPARGENFLQAGKRYSWTFRIIRR
jgi:hypothetical protein